MNIGEKILLARRKLNLNQEDLADKIPTSRATISRWESGLGEPSVSDMQKISEATGQPISFFIESKIAEPQAPYLSPAIIEALEDEVAVKALLAVHAGKEDIKLAIRQMLECLPNMNSEKRNALLALCR